MAVQASTKRGVKSTSRKTASSRHGLAPTPRARPVAGAFGGEGRDRKTPRSAGPLMPRAARTDVRRAGAKGPVGISNRPLSREQNEQRRLPPRGQARGR